jgi:hypothetical protein
LYDAPVSDPHIRKVRLDDLEEVWRVHVAASNDLLVRRGRPATRLGDTPVASDARAGLASDPDGCFCAVDEGQIRGMVERSTTLHPACYVVQDRQGWAPRTTTA